MISNAVAFGWVSAALQVADLGGPSATTPKNPCALLKATEIQALAPTARISDGISSSLPGSLGSLACGYQWGPGGNVASGRFYLKVILSDASKIFPGLDPSTITQGLLAEARSGNANTAVVPGVGDAATLTSDSPTAVKTTAYVKGSLLEVDLEGSDARARKDQVIGLLKSAAARL